MWKYLNSNKKINIYSNHFLLSSTLNFTSKVSPSTIIYNLRKLADIHMQIVETIEIINKTFSIAMLLYFSIAFYWCCILLFVFMKTSASSWREIYMFLLLKLATNAFMFSILIAVIWSSVKAQNEGRKTAMILYKIKNEIDDQEVVDKVRLWIKKFILFVFYYYFFQITAFIDQVKFTSAKFSCGFFTFDWKLLFKVKKKIKFLLFYDNFQ